MQQISLKMEFPPCPSWWSDHLLIAVSFLRSLTSEVSKQWILSITTWGPSHVLVSYSSYLPIEYSLLFPNVLWWQKCQLLRKDFPSHNWIAADLINSYSFPFSPPTSPKIQSSHLSDLKIRPLLSPGHQALTHSLFFSLLISRTT